MAAKSNYFKESGFHTWRFHSVGKRKPPLAASACRPRGPALTKSSHATCCKSFTSICGTFGFISLRPATHSNPSRFKAHAWRYIRDLRARRVCSVLHEKSASSLTRSKARGLPRVRHHITRQRFMKLVFKPIFHSGIPARSSITFWLPALSCLPVVSACFRARLRTR